MSVTYRLTRIALAALPLMLSACHDAPSVAMPSKAAVCRSCHAAPGRATAPIYPHLDGQHAVYLEAQLRAFRSGERKNPIMGGMAQGLSNDEIRALSQWFQQQGRSTDNSESTP